MKILVRLPNWLGDMVMSTAFIRALKDVYPSSEIDVIVKRGLETLVDFIPLVNNRFVFSKDEWKGLRGAYRFGKKIKNKTRYDLFFCLPDSFSSALMGRATGARKRLGFKKELRSFFLTHSFTKPVSGHRVEQYLSLLEQFVKKEISLPWVLLSTSRSPVPNRVIVNFNSEAESRRMPVAKAASILNEFIRQIPNAEFICIGSLKEKDHVDSILALVDQNRQIKNHAGLTNNLTDLIQLIASGTVMLTTDSGPAHVANALGVPVVVTFGAGNENNTAPFNNDHLTVLRLGQLPCEPCMKNVCKFGLPKCLEGLAAGQLTDAVKRFMIAQ